MYLGVGPAGVHAEGTAVGRQLLYVKDAQAVCFHDAHGREHRKIREVLVVDRVKFVVFDQSQQVGKLQGQNPLRFQQDFKPFDKIIEVRDLRQYVVSANQVGRAALGHKFACNLDAEETHERWNSVCDRHLCNVHGRLDSQQRNISPDEVLQQVAVVARDLYDKALLAQSKPLDNLVAVFLAVLQPGIRVR